MILLDTELQRRESEGNPIRVGMIGAGFAARGVAHQLLTPLTGMRLVAIANRTPAKALRLLEDKQVSPVHQVDSLSEFERAVMSGAVAVTGDHALACQSDQVDVVVDTTGQVEFGARVATAAIEHGKHLVIANAELDATLGPILKRKADSAGVVISNTDGDEPAVAMNLYRYVKTIGYRPVLAGNIKGFMDVHRNPDTQREFARRVNQQPPMIVSFADGTKLSMECAILANATGMSVSQRGMRGPRCEHVMDITNHFTPELLLERPLVDFALGAQPGNGAFVVGYNDEPAKQDYMKYFKMGDGPLYVFYTPFHLPPFQLPVTIGRVVLFRDAAVSPLGKPVCDVVAVAKRDLKAGDTLDGIGGYTCYGQIENVPTSIAQQLLPMGLSQDCRMVRDVPQDSALTYKDVQIPDGRLCDELRRQQDNWLVDRAGAEPETNPR